MLTCVALRVEHVECVAKHKLNEILVAFMKSRSLSQSYLTLSTLVSTWFPVSTFYCLALVGDMKTSLTAAAYKRPQFGQ